MNYQEESVSFVNRVISVWIYVCHWAAKDEYLSFDDKIEPLWSECIKMLHFAAISNIFHSIQLYTIENRINHFYCKMIELDNLLVCHFQLLSALNFPAIKRINSPFRFVQEKWLKKMLNCLYHKSYHNCMKCWTLSKPMNNLFVPGKFPNVS